MRSLILASLALAALAACGRSQAPPAPHSAAVQPFDLHIEIGRYGVMLNQAHDLTSETAGNPEEPEQPRALARALRETAWEYNLERSRLCARAILPQASCGPSYNPVWLADPADAEVSLEELKTRADALGQEVSQFWGAICDDARSRVTDEDQKRLICAIE